MLKRGFANFNANGTTQQLVITGLDPAKIYDLYIASAILITTNQCSRGEWFTTNTTSTVGNQPVDNTLDENGSTWVRGNNYVLFEDVVPNASGNITVNGFAITGAPYDIRLPLNGFQLVESAPVPGYSTWANGTFTPALTAKLPTDNQDSDTLTNLQEYAFGTQPTVSTGGSISYVAGGAITATGLPVATNFAVGGGVDYRGVFGRRKDYVAAGLTYTPQFSVDLATWQNSAATPTVLTGAGGLNPSEIEAVSVPYPLFIPYTRDGIPGFEKPTFFRVAVSQP
jgi:hypothetical protein